jgi:hypothetical protein
VDTLSLKQIILAIPDDGVRGNIESAYVARDFDEVERGLINYLEEYDYEDSGVKEKAMGIIYERVKETRAFNDPAFQDVEDPDSSEDEDMDELTVFEETIKNIESMELPELVAQHMVEGEAKTKLLKDIESGDTTMTSADLDNYIDYSVQKWYPGMPEAHVELLKNLLHEKVNDYFGTKEFEEGADEDEGPPESLDESMQLLQSMDLDELVEMLPPDLKVKMQEEMANGQLSLAEDDLDKIVGANAKLPEEFKEDAKAFIHKKFMAYGTKEFEEGADEDEVEGPPESLDESMQLLQSMDLVELVDMLPPDLKDKIQEEMANGQLSLAENDLDKIVDAYAKLPEEFKEDAKAIIHEKFMTVIHEKEMAHGTKEFEEGGSELMEGKSSIVDALRDIAETQQKITELINDLEGGI